MTTLANLEVMVSRDLRDTTNATWSLGEIDDYINAGIDRVSGLYPKEVVDFSTVISAGVYSYALPSTLTRIYRVDIYSSANSYTGKYDQSVGDAETGWEVHNGVIWLSPLNIPTASSKLRLFGYGPWLQLSAASAVTDMDTKAQWGVRSFCKYQGFHSLLFDRARFQQWQTDQTNSDVSMTQLLQLFSVAQSAWERRKQSLRTMRK